MIIKDNHINDKARSVMFSILMYYGFNYSGHYNGNFIFENSKGDGWHEKDHVWIKIWVYGDKPGYAVYGGYHSNEHNMLCHTYDVFDTDVFEKMLKDNIWLDEIIEYKHEYDKEMKRLVDEITTHVDENILEQIRKEWHANEKGNTSQG